MPRADRVSIPADSPLAAGWRRRLVALIVKHGLVEILDTLAAYAEFRKRLEPLPEHIDPLDCDAPVRRRISGKLSILTLECKASGRHRGFLPNPKRIRSNVAAVVS